jgi:hypothetical protein
MKKLSLLFLVVFLMGNNIFSKDANEGSRLGTILTLTAAYTYAFGVCYLFERYWPPPNSKKGESLNSVEEGEEPIPPDEDGCQDEPSEEQEEVVEEDADPDILTADKLAEILYSKGKSFKLPSDRSGASGKVPKFRRPIYD